jgi:hypothetical protein
MEVAGLLPGRSMRAFGCFFTAGLYQKVGRQDLGKANIRA